MRHCGNGWNRDRGEGFGMASRRTIRAVDEGLENVETAEDEAGCRVRGTKVLQAKREVRI